MPASKPSVPPLRRASAPPVPKPSTRWLKKPSAPPTPQNLPCLDLESLHTKQVRRPVDASTPKREHLELRRAFDTRDSRKPQRLRPQRDLQRLESSRAFDAGSQNDTPYRRLRDILCLLPPERDRRHNPTHSHWHRESTLGASSSESLSVFEFQRTMASRPSAPKTFDPVRSDDASSPERLLASSAHCEPSDSDKARKPTESTASRIPKDLRHRVIAALASSCSSL
jgi:hypothetical protein